MKCHEKLHAETNRSVLRRFFSTLVNPTHVLLIVMLSTLVYTSAVINIQQTKIALEGRDVNLVCNVQPFNNNVLVSLCDNDNVCKTVFNCKPQTRCVYEEKGQCGDCNATVNVTSIDVHIAHLNRSMHQNYWSCNNVSVYLTIHTAPTKLTLEKLPAINNDTTLSTAQVALKCNTDCAFPGPNITWYYSGNGVTYTYHDSVGYTESEIGSCEQPERIYSSILKLDEKLAYTRHIKNNVSFHCGIYYFIENGLWINSTSIFIPYAGYTEVDGSNSNGGAIAGTVCAILTITMLVVVLEKKTGRISSLLRKKVSKTECASDRGENTDKKTGKSSNKILSKINGMNIFNCDGLVYADLDFENVPIVTGKQPSGRKPNSHCSKDLTVYHQIDFKTNAVPLLE